MAHSNENFERMTRTTKRNTRPPGDTEQEARKQAAKRGKAWNRGDDKRDQWQTIGGPEF